MDKSHNILILDDDERWIEKHTYQLMNAGYNPIPIQYGEKAKERIRKDTSLNIRAAIIDQILLNPDDQKTKQPLQGEDVIRYIKSKRRDGFLCIMVTEAHVKQAETKDDVSIISYNLKKSTGAEYFDKGVLKKNYNELIDYLKNNIKGKPKITGDVLFVIDVDQNVYHVTGDPKKFGKNFHEYLKLISSHEFDIGIEKWNIFLAKYKKNLHKLDKLKRSKQPLRLLQEVSEQTLSRQQPIIFSKSELMSILDIQGKSDGVKSRVCKIDKTICELAEIPNKLSEFNKGLGGWKMNFNVLNLYRFLAKEMRKNHR